MATEQINNDKKGKKQKKIQEVIIPKKRGRKPKKIIEDIDKLNVIKNEEDCKKPIILHLPIDIDNVVNTIQKNKINIEDDFLISESSDNDICLECIENKKVIKKLKEELNNCKKELQRYKNSDNMVHKLNVELFDNDTGNGLNNNNNIACWWCCHNFDTKPICIPEKIEDNKWYGFGFFCSFNCAMAYNSDINDSKIWERMTLIKKLYKMNYELNDGILEDIVNAPPKQILKKFGGPLDIEEYRNKFQIFKNFKVLYPPIISIIPVIEEMKILMK